MYLKRMYILLFVGILYYKWQFKSVDWFSSFLYINWFFFLSLFSERWLSKSPTTITVLSVSLFNLSDTLHVFWSSIIICKYAWDSYVFLMKCFLSLIWNLSIFDNISYPKVVSIPDVKCKECWGLFGQAVKLLWGQLAPVETCF